MFRLFDLDWLLGRSIPERTLPNYDLPPEVWANICSWLSPNNVLRLGMSNKALYQVNTSQLEFVVLMNLIIKFPSHTPHWFYQYGIFLHARKLTRSICLLCLFFVCVCACACVCVCVCVCMYVCMYVYMCVCVSRIAKTISSGLQCAIVKVGLLLKKQNFTILNIGPKNTNFATVVGDLSI